MCVIPTSRSAGWPFSSRWRHWQWSFPPSPRASPGCRRASSRAPAFWVVVWVTAAGLTVARSATTDIVGPALLGGLVLIVMLIGFTVMQHAFAGGGATTGVVSDVERRALALTGSGDLIWDWDVSADKVFTSPETEALLGLKRGTLEGPAAKWLEVLHPLDQDRFRAAPAPLLDP